MTGRGAFLPYHGRREGPLVQDRRNQHEPGVPPTDNDVNWDCEYWKTSKINCAADVVKVFISVR